MPRRTRSLAHATALLCALLSALGAVPAGALPAPRAWKGVDAQILELEHRVEKRAGDATALGWLHGRAQFAAEEPSPTRLAAFLKRVIQGKGTHPLMRDHARILLARTLLEGGDAKGARAQLALAGVVDKVWLVGPFENTGGASLDVNLGLEDVPGLMKDFEGLSRSVRWRPVEDVGPTGVLSLGDHMGHKEDTLAAVLCLVHSDSAQDVALRVGASDQLRVIFNGVLVLRAQEVHPVAPDQHVVPVHLESGWNRAVFVVGQLGGAGGLMARFTLPLGGAAPGVTFAVDPAVEALAVAAKHTPATTPVVDPLQQVSMDAPPAAYLDLSATLTALHAQDERQRPWKSSTLLEAMRLAQGDDAALLTALAQAQDLHEVNATRELLQRALVVDPGYAPAWLALGLLQERQDLPAAARLTLSKAVEADRTFTRAAVAYWQARSQDGDELDLAAQQLGLLAARRPSRAALEGWMLAEQARGGWARAKDIALRLRDKWPGHAGARWVLLEAAKRKGDVAGVLQAQKAQRALAPHSEAAALGMGETLWALQGPAAAEVELQGYAQAHPDSAAVLVRLGEMRQRQGNVVGALAAWNQALTVNPQDGPLRRHVEALGGQGRFEQRQALDLGTLLRAPPSAAAVAAGVYCAGHLWAHRLYDNGLSTGIVDVAWRVLDAGKGALVRTQSALYAPGRETLEVLTAERLTPDGQVYAAQVTEASSSESQGVYTEERKVTADFGVLGAGDVVHWRYRVDATGERNLFGEFFGVTHFVQDELPTAWLSVVVEAPASKPLHHAVVRLPPVREEERAGVRVYSINATHLPGLVVEALMPAYPEVGAYAMFSSYGTWEDLGHWYQGLIKDALVMDAALKKVTEDLVAGAPDELEKVRRIHRWVLQNTRYVGIELGIHGWKPYGVTQVAARGYGDCKDKASLLVAMLRHAGVDARLALVRTQDLGTLVDLPSMWSFNHAVAHVPSRALFLDGTAEFSGMFELPAGDQGAMALSVDVNTGAAARVVPALRASKENSNTSEYTLTVSPNGAVHFEGQETFTGVRAAQQRARLQDTATQKQVLEEELARQHPGASVVTVVVTGEKNLDAPLVYAWSGDIPSWGVVTGAGMHVPVTLYPHHLEQEYSATAQRTQELVLPTRGVTQNVMHFVLPPGWTALRLPASGKAVTAEFEYAQTITVDPQGYTVDETAHIKEARVAPPAYKAWRQALLDADKRMAVRVRLVGPHP